MSISCPRCRSEKINHDGILEVATCEYCMNTFYPVSHNELLEAIVDSTEIGFPQFKNTLKILNVADDGDRIQVRLNGRNGGEYRLRISSDHTSELSRKKSPSERNQFGNRWKTITGNTWPTKLE